MTSLPASADITGSSTTEGQAKTWLDAVRTYIAQQLGANGTQAESLAALGVLCNGSATKTAAYDVVAADRGKVILYSSGSYTLGTAVAAATLGDGFAFGVLNKGSGTITINPYGTETIDGAATKEIAAGKMAIVYCDGVAFTTIGSISTGSGSGLDADLLDGLHASGLDYVKKDHGHNAIGSLCFAASDYLAISAGSTESGSRLHIAGIHGTQGGTAEIFVSTTGTLSGTWRCLGYCVAPSSQRSGTLWQRVA